MKIAFIGFGEAAQAFTRGWRDAGLGAPLSIAAYDILFDADPAAAEKKRAACEACAALEVRAASDARDAVAGAELVLIKHVRV